MDGIKDVNINYIIIELKYKEIDSDEWRIKDITVKEYFDFSMLDEGEELEIDSVPRYNNLIDYFNDKQRQITQIYIDIIDTKRNMKLHFLQLFWNNQNNWICERIDTVNGVIDYQGFIIESLLPIEITNNRKKDYEILRFSLEKEGIKREYHGIIHDNEDGSQSEIIISG